MSDESPFCEPFEAANGKDVESGLLDDLAERLRLAVAVLVGEGHVLVADGARGGDRLSRMLGAKEAGDVHAHVGLRQVFPHQTAARHRVAHVAPKFPVGGSRVNVGATGPLAQRVDEC